MNIATIFSGLITGARRLIANFREAFFGNWRLQAVSARPGTKFLFLVPDEAGEVIDMTMLPSGDMVLACKNGVWISRRPYSKCEKVLIK